MLAALVLAALQGQPVPAEFEPGASKQANRTAELPLRPRLRREYAALAARGKVADLLQDDAKWMPYIIAGLTSDNEAIAKTSFRALSDFCVKHQISASEEGFKNPVKIEFVNSAYYRAGEYAFWSEWWGKNRKRAVPSEDPALAKWDEIMAYLRAGGGFDDPTRPEGMAFAKVKLMGGEAYPYLARYIDHEDILLGRAAAAVLNALTGRSEPLPNDSTKAQRKSEWEAWIAKDAAAFPPPSPEVLALLGCRTPEAEVRALIERLSSDDPAERQRCAGALRPCSFRHENLLKAARAETADPETRARLNEVLAYLESMRDDLEDALEASPESAVRTRVEEAVAGREWSKAIRGWNELAAASPARGETARAEIARLEALAREELDRLRKKAVLLAEGGKKAEGLELLKSARPRFALTRWAAELQTRIGELDR